MIVYALLFSVIILFLVALVFSQGEIFSPPVIITLGFIAAILSAIYNVERWGLDLHWNTYWIIVGGLTIFIVVAIILRYIYQKKYAYRRNSMGCGQLPYFQIDGWKIYLILLCDILFTIAYYFEVAKIVQFYRGKLNWTETMFWSRYYISYGEGNMQISTLVDQGFEMINFLGYVCIYILINNYLSTKKIDARLLVLALCLLCSSFVTSGRTDVIKFPVAAICYFCILYERKTGKKIQINIKLVVRCILAFVGLCVVFVWLKSIAGRIDDRTPFYYITYYLGQSVYCLNEFLQEPRIKPELWGEETFYGLNHLLGMVTGNEKYDYVVHKAFRFYRGESVGNVYTMFRAFIYDFGYTGMIVLTAIFSFIINYMYMRLKHVKKMIFKNKIDYTLIIWSYLMFSVYTAFFADYFFNVVLSLRAIKFLLAIYVGYWFLLKVKIKIR